MTSKRDLEQRLDGLREGADDGRPVNLAEVLSDLMAEDDSNDE